MTYDVAIIGAGPSGATLARLIADSFKVLLVDKRQLTNRPQNISLGKCCGGLLAPDAQAMLSKMGLGLPKSVLAEPQLFVVRAIDTHQNLERYYQRYYINMNRLKFEQWLLGMVPSSVDIRLDCRFKSYQSENSRFKLNLLQHGTAHIEHAAILIGADGASSAVRKQAVPHHPFPKKYLAIQQWLEADTKLPYFSTIFDPEITDYYCWTIPKQDSLIIGAALHSSPDVSNKFELLKNKLKDYGFRFGKTTRRQAAFISRPVNTKQISTGTKSIALLGEAAGWISPSSAEGLSYAFNSALILAQVLRKTRKNFESRYYQKTRRLRRNIFLKNIKSHFIYTPWLRKMVMTSGIQSMQVYKS